MTDIETLYRTYFRDVYLYAVSITGDVHMAADVTSETFLKAMKSIDGFRGDCDVRIWLLKIARNCCYTMLKRAGRDAQIEQAEEKADDSGKTDPERAALSSDEFSRAKTAVNELCEPYKEVFTLRVYGELSFRDIGRVFGKTDNWACVTYHRARKILIERMER